MVPRDGQRQRSVRLPAIRRVATAFVALSSFVLTAHAQTVYLSGNVVSSETGEHIGGATIGLVSTTHGVKANRDGAFRMALAANTPSRLRVTAFGYRADTLDVQISRDSNMNIGLATLTVEGGNVTVVADRSRSEGRRIMRQVIETKETWQQQIKNYTFSVYSRINVRTVADSASKVIAILESFADGYWDRQEGYAERIRGRKQTANLPIDANQVALFDLENFYNDRLAVGDYDLVGPAARDAFDRYDFDLEGTGELNGANVYKIRIQPLSRLYPAFQGILWIDQIDYTIVYLDVSPNEAIKLGPVQNAHISQTFTFVDNKYWLPNQLSFSAELRFDLPIAPRLKIEQNAVLNDYVINGVVPDSIFRRTHGIASEARSIDSLDWTELRSIPLAQDEVRAYARIDSLVRVPPAKMSLSPTSILFTILSQPDVYQFNRVEGSRLQFSTGVEEISGWPLGVDGTIGYSFGQREWKYSANVTQALTWHQQTIVTGSFSSNGDVDVSARGKHNEITSSIGFSYFKETLRRGEAYSPLVNTATALLLHEDYPNYYDAHGFEASLQYYVGKERLRERLYFRREDSQSDTNVTNFSLLSRLRQYRTNPRVNAGIWQYVGAEFNGATPLEHWDIHGALHAEYGWTNSIGVYDDFFMMGGLSLTMGKKLGGWGDLSVIAKGDHLFDGILPAQRKLYLETHDGPIRAPGAFNTLRPFEFESDNMLQVSIDQDFYDLPLRLIGVELPFNMHWIAFANYASFDPMIVYYSAEPHPDDSAHTEDHVTEVGLALGGILNVLRLDAGWRLTQHRPFVVTGTFQFSF
jgi:hypothetical protein